MKFSVKRTESGQWDVLQDDKPVRPFSYHTRSAARWNAKRFEQAQAERELFLKVYTELFTTSRQG